MSEHCYWCGKQKTSMEHVPPRCLFPKIKDAPQLGNQRKNLITVPSCDLHNSEKSGDDEYLMCILSANILNNNLAETHIKTKIIRALKKSPSLMSICFGTNQDIVISDDDGKTLQHTKAFQVDGDRLLKCLEHIARALYYHHFGVRHSGSVQCNPEFVVEITGPDARQKNEKYETFRKCCDEAFQNIPKLGNNPDVFFHQIINNPNEKMTPLIRLTFYSGAKATAIFHAQQNAQADAG